MKLILFFCALLGSSLLQSQTNDQLFVKQKLQLLISIADKDLESIKTICKLEPGLVNKENEGDVYVYFFTSVAKDYTVKATFQFNQLYCNKIKFEIIPANNKDMDIDEMVTNTLKSKFTIKKNSVSDDKAHTKISFLSNGRYSGILSSYSDTKKIVLTMSRKAD
jgi:hypothetical protein